MSKRSIMKHRHHTPGLTFKQRVYIGMLNKERQAAGGKADSALVNWLVAKLKEDAKFNKWSDLKESIDPERRARLDAEVNKELLTLKSDLHIGDKLIEEDLQHVQATSGIEPAYATPYARRIVVGSE